VLLHLLYMWTKTTTVALSFILLLFWHALLRVRSAKVVSEWLIVSHINCFIHGEVIGFQVLLNSLQARLVVWGGVEKLLGYS